MEKVLDVIDEKPIETFFVYQTNDEMWNPGYNVVKANAHSMYIWHESRFTDAFTLHIYEINKEAIYNRNVEEKGLYRLVSVRTNSLYEPYELG